MKLNTILEAHPMTAEHLSDIRKAITKAVDVLMTNEKMSEGDAKREVSRLVDQITLKELDGANP